MLACAAARAFAASLLEQRMSIGCDGNAPVSHEVVADHRHAGLGQLSRPLCRLPTVLTDSFSSLCAPKKNNRKQQETTGNNWKQWVPSATPLLFIAGSLELCSTLMRFQVGLLKLPGQEKRKQKGKGNEKKEGRSGEKRRKKGGNERGKKGRRKGKEKAGKKGKKREGKKDMKKMKGRKREKRRK